jgi:hypothetical protein
MQARAIVRRRQANVPVSRVYWDLAEDLVSQKIVNYTGFSRLCGMLCQPYKHVIKQYRCTRTCKTRKADRWNLHVEEQGFGEKPCAM